MFTRWLTSLLKGEVSSLWGVWWLMYNNNTSMMMTQEFEWLLRLLMILWLVQKALLNSLVTNFVVLFSLTFLFINCNLWAVFTDHCQNHSNWPPHCCEASGTWWFQTQIELWSLSTVVNGIHRLPLCLHSVICYLWLVATTSYLVVLLTCCFNQRWSANWTHWMNIWFVVYPVSLFLK